MLRNSWEILRKIPAVAVVAISVADPVWTGGSNIYDSYASSDGGKSFRDETNQILFGAYFFLSDNVVTHERNRYNLFQLLSDFGGLYQTFIIPFFIMIGANINSKLIKQNLFGHCFS